MKLERMNDQQIRCILTAEDLRERRIKISELAYGTDKAQSLFRDMMIQAAGELDFEVNGEPLMIEAVPLSGDSMVLTVTKVDDPDELDTRFARFAPDVIGGDLYDEPDDSDYMVSPEDLQSWLTEGMAKQKTPAHEAGEEPDPDLNRLFSMSSLDSCIELAGVLSDDYDGVNSLYRDERTGRYLLMLGRSGMELIGYNRICNIVSEYGRSERNLQATAAYLDEHCELIIRGRALQELSSLAL